MNELKATDSLVLGKSYKATIKVDLKGLKPEDIGFDFVITETNKEGVVETVSCEAYKFVKMEDNLAVYELVVTPSQSGIFNYSVRMYPYSDFLPYRQDFPYVKWL